MTKLEAPKLTREEQNQRMIPLMRRLLPPVMHAATLFNKEYPLDKTDPAVIDAVTVPVPLRHFMLMTSLVTNLCLMEEERVKAENKQANEAFPQDHIPEGAA